MVRSMFTKINIYLNMISLGNEAYSFFGCLWEIEIDVLDILVAPE